MHAMHMPSDRKLASAPMSPDDAASPGDDALHGQKVSRRVLIADDEDDTRWLLRVALEGAGWDVLEARDGQEAFERIIDDQPDVVVLDNRMPRRNGADVYRELRKGNVQVPIVLMTGGAKASELARSLGMRFFLAKPFYDHDLLAVVARAFDTAAHG